MKNLSYHEQSTYALNININRFLTYQTYMKWMTKMCVHVY